MKKLFSILFITFTILAASICHGSDENTSKKQQTQKAGFSNLKMLEADNRRLAQEVDMLKSINAVLHAENQQHEQNKKLLLNIIQVGLCAAFDNSDRATQEGMKKDAKDILKNLTKATEEHKQRETQ